MRTAKVVEKIPSMPADVAAVFRSYPPRVNTCLMEVRRLIFVTAATVEGIGVLTETLKWGEPAYLTEASKSGSTIRLGRVPKQPDRCAVYFNCKTTLLDSFRAQFADTLALAGDRAIILDPTKILPEAPLQMCLTMALTYHRAKRVLPAPG